MITSFLFTVFSVIISGLLAPLLLLPDVVLPPSLANALAAMVAFTAQINPLFPLSQLFIALGIVVGIEIAIFSYKVIMWLIKKIPTIN